MDDRRASVTDVVLVSLSLVLLLSAALAWRYTPLHRFIDVDRLTAIARSLPSGWGLLVSLSGFLVGALLVLPLNLLILVTVVSFGAWPGALYAYLGAVAASLLTYWLGHTLGGRRVRRLFGRRSERVRRAIVDRGIPSIAMIRVTPTAPFTVVNLIAGVIGVRVVDFLVGTLLGLLPGVLALALFGDRLLDVIRHPTLARVAVLGAIIVALTAVGLLVQKLIRRRAGPVQR